jgi:hypothetical protein
MVIGRKYSSRSVLGSLRALRGDHSLESQIFHFIGSLF